MGSMQIRRQPFFSLFLLMDLKGETMGVKRREGHYRDSCEGHVHVRLAHSLCVGGG